ncbi:GNAT family protein [Aquicoccus sp. G2-2]|uniref:GNAT family N-acetyltransferase n=1 Tax=Aquicoccus sp. G2-2 TaxID=3092120 RepID=UPI002ADFA6C2|nr:GNAT family protein [Aquicoccus sp. G2-2]MEA1113114.1 GNAT family protein [Aquicoccus sp. G2-2]
MNATNEYGQPIGAPLIGSYPRPLPPRTPMTGRYCSLVPVSLDHAAGLYDAFQTAEDGRHWTYLPADPFTSPADACGFVEKAQASDDPLYFTVLDGTGQPVGWASYLRIDPANGVIEVGWINFSPLLQQTIASTEAMFLMMARVFDELGYRRYEWKCDALNAPSRRAAQRLGFTYEGTFRQAVHYKGRNRDTAWFSVLDTEWPALREEFRRWLAADNFDAHGQQKSRLAMPE